MTILLLRPYATFAQGSTIDLDNATEAALVGQGRATYTVNPGSAFSPLTVTEQQELDIDMTWQIESTMLAWQIRRLGSDASAGTARLFEFDIHYQIGKLGTASTFS